jgi:hypothetical protein
MSSTVAIVAITSGATLSAAAVTAYASHAQARLRSSTEASQMRARFRHERSLHDLDELRGLLDEAADAIRSVRAAVNDPQNATGVEDGLALLRPLHSRLALRLGADNHLTHDSSEVIEALDFIEEHYENLSFNSEQEEDEFMDTLDALKDEARDAFDRFLEHAQQIVGAQLLIPDQGATDPT